MIRSAGREDGTVRVTVRDNGPGLAICRSIVEAHGGTLRTQNEEPHGACLTFTLPSPGGTIA